MPKSTQTAAAPRRRALQEIEVFQKLHFADLIRPEVEARLSGKENVSKSERMKVVRQASNLLYAAASEEIKAIVKAKCVESRVEVQQTKENHQVGSEDEAEGEDSINPAMIQQ